MTIVESIKCVLQQNNDGLTSKQIYDEIILNCTLQNGHS